MASIKTIIDEMRTLATDYCDVNSFLFDESSCFNLDNNLYPMILVESRGIDKDNVGKLNINFMPISKQYVLKVYFAEVYGQTEINAAKTKEEAYEDVERYADQYFAELKRRILDDPSLNIEFETTRSGFVTDKGFTDCLVFSVCDAVFIAKSDCTVGQFDSCP